MISYLRRTGFATPSGTFVFQAGVMKKRFGAGCKPAPAGRAKRQRSTGTQRKPLLFFYEKAVRGAGCGGFFRTKRFIGLISLILSLTGKKPMSVSWRIWNTSPWTGGFIFQNAAILLNKANSMHYKNLRGHLAHNLLRSPASRMTPALGGIKAVNWG